MKNLILVIMALTVSFPVFAKDMGVEDIRSCMRNSDKYEDVTSRIKSKGRKLDNIDSRLDSVRTSLSINKAFMPSARSSAQWNGNYNYYNSLVRKHNNYVRQEKRLVRKFNRVNDSRNSLINKQKRLGRKSKRNCGKSTATWTDIKKACRNDKSNKFCKSFK